MIDTTIFQEISKDCTKTCAPDFKSNQPLDLNTSFRDKVYTQDFKTKF